MTDEKLKDPMSEFDDDDLLESLGQATYKEADMDGSPGKRAYSFNAGHIGTYLIARLLSEILTELKIQRWEREQAKLKEDKR